MSKSELEEKFDRYWALLKNIHQHDMAEREYQINAPHSKHAWDFAWPAEKVAVEINGGTWLAGRSGHAGGLGAVRDAKKNNIAVLCGWVVLYATTDMLTDETIVEFCEVVSKVLDQRKP